MDKFYAVAEPDIGAHEEEFLLDAFRSGWISSLGSYIGRFEEEFSNFCSAKHGIAVCNGTAALHLSLVALGIGAGDEVILPSLTFVATSAAIRHAGATPVFVDCIPEIGVIDPDAVQQAITDKTKAIIAVHLYGHPADADAILKIANTHNLFFIEDAAEAHGAKCRGKRVGGLGHVGIFSFYGNKVLTTGEGGMITTNDDKLDQRIRLLRDHAMDKERRYWHPEVGFNYRITNLQAAIGVAQLDRYEELKTKREKILENYKKSGIEKKYFLSFNPQLDWATPTVWLISIVFKDKLNIEKRNLVAKKLREKGIDTRPYFIPNHKMPPYKSYRVVGALGGSSLPVSDALSMTGLNLPSSTNLTKDDILYITENLETAIESI